MTRVDQIERVIAKRIFLGSDIYYRTNVYRANELTRSASIQKIPVFGIICNDLFLSSMILRLRHVLTILLT